MLPKGIKRKRIEEEVELPTTTPSSSLFSISVSKLHQSLQHVEPNLRHLVLVANTLRRIQDEMQPAAALSDPQQQALGRGAPLAAVSVPAGHDPMGSLQGACRRSPLPPPPSPTPVDNLLLSSMDFSVFSTILEDFSNMEDFGGPLQLSSTQPEGGELCLPGPEPDRTPHPCPGPLEILGPGGYLLEESLEGIFEDIDTSMYDCDLWPPSSLPSFKEAFSSAEEEERLDLAELDYLMDAIVRAQEP